jgi:hypothetical protein
MEKSGQKTRKNSTKKRHQTALNEGKSKSNLERTITTFRGDSEREPALAKLEAP